MKFLHLADLHLDTPFKGLSQNLAPYRQVIQEAPYTAFQRAIIQAVNQQVDFVIISGDVYNADQQSVKARYIFKQQLEILDQNQIPVIVIHGNHDYLKEGKEEVSYPENTYVFPGEGVSSYDLSLKSGDLVRFHGFSYQHRHIHQDKVQEFPPAAKDVAWNVGLYHGAARGSQHNTYAPFRLEDLIAKGYDYWAMGHVHQRKVLHEVPAVIYPGNIQGRHRHEQGDKGGYLITLEAQQPLVKEFISLAPIRWERVSVTCQFGQEGPDLVKLIQQAVKNYADQSLKTQQSYLLDFHFSHCERLDEGVQEELKQGKIQELVSPEQVQDQFAVLASSQLHYDSLYDLTGQDSGLQASLAQAMESIQDPQVVQDALEAFYKHPVVRTWLGEMSQDKELREEIIDRAQGTLLQYFGLGEEDPYED